MTRTSFRATALGGLLLATTCLTAPALAQTSEPAHRAVDANGVDLVTGTYPFALAEGTIGSGEGAISVERHGTDPGGVGNWQNMYAYQTISGSATTVIVTLGDRSERFTSTSGGAFVAAQGNGATLTGGNHADFVYTTPDGTAITFGAGVEDQSGASNMCSHVNANQNGCYGVPTGITGPNAATISFGWDVHANCANYFNGDGSLDCTYTWRLDTVANSFGYGVDYSYVSNSVSMHQNPSGNWFKRSGAVLSNGGTTRSVSYNFVSSTVTEITDADGRVWRLTNGTNSFGIRRPGSSSDDVSVTFSSGIVTQVVRDGFTTSYSRSVSGATATTTITDALSQTTIVVADTSLARITSITDPLSRQTQYQYDTNGRLTRVTRPEGDYSAFAYDSRGNLTETRRVAKPGTGLADIVAGATYASTCDDPACNQPLTATDARGHTTDYSYDATHGGVESVTAPAPGGSGTRPETRYSYTLTNGEYLLTGISACATGSAPSCIGTSDETRVAIGYDANGNATSIEQRSGNSSGAGAMTATNIMTYDGVGNLLTVDGPLAGATDTIRYRYNSARQAIGVVGPDPDDTGALHHRAVRTSYGADGQPTRVERGTVDSQSDSDWANFATLEEVQTEYDAHHRPVVQRLVSGSTTHALTQTSYDSLGRPECVAQRMNVSEFATSSLPADACTLDTEGSHGPDRIARTTYDIAGQATKVQTGYGVTGVQADEVATTYSDNGRVATVTDAEGNMTTYEYDGFDRLRNTRFPSPATAGVSAPTSGTGADYEQLGYDANSNVTSRRLRDGVTIGYAYDNLNRLTGIDRPAFTSGSYLDLLDTFHAYDNMGRMIAATQATPGYPGQAQWNLAFSYDALGRLLSQADPLGTVSYAYDAAGRRTAMTYPGSGLVVGYSYDSAGDLTEIRENPSGSNTLLATYAYDDRGRRTSLTRGNGAITNYSYDNVSRLTQIAQDLDGTSNDLTLGFSHNPAGQIAGTSRTNDAYAWTNHYAVNRNYTANGLNQYTASGAASLSYDARGNLIADGSRSFGYSSENMMISAWPRSLIHDPLGRLVQLDTAAGFDRFGYDGPSLIVEYDGSNAVARRYVHGPGTDEPLVWYEGSGTGTRRYLHADERGSVVAVSDGSGALLSVNSYDEHGIPGAGNAGRFQYTGQAWLPELGMYYYRARMYSPTLGRFMQTDPIGYGDGMNMYAYVGNDPVNFVDPLGSKKVCVEQPGTRIRVCVDVVDADNDGSTDDDARDAEAWLLFQFRNPEIFFSNSQEMIEYQEQMARELERMSQSGIHYQYDSAMTRAMERDAQAVLTGRISQAEYWNRAQARAGGVAVGFATLALARAGFYAIGPSGPLFGTSRLRGAYNSGYFNYGLTRIGWSYNQRTGLLEFTRRVGSDHGRPWFTMRPPR